jgi:hydroxyacylglutathione hydrolase
MNRRYFISSLLFLLFLSNFCLSQEKYILNYQVTGIIKSNCYLLYDAHSKEAALFDVGGPIDSLLTIIIDEGLKLKYIFCTHCHVDHVYGVPAIKTRYPEVKICFSREEYEDTKLYEAWESKLDSSMVAEMKKSPSTVELMNFDFSLLGKPEVELSDNQIFSLGELEIKTFLSPGHSRGSICFNTQNILLSGDVLFYRTVGRRDLPGSGSKEDIVKSVRRLYFSLSDKTKVYPGHGRFTDIESEKKENTRVTINGGLWSNL